jgi:hypothetical protein
VPASASEISIADRPCWRSWMIVRRAASLAGAVVGPGPGVAKNPVLPARKSRTAERSVATDQPARRAASAAEDPSNRYARKAS